MFDIGGAEFFLVTYIMCAQSTIEIFEVEICA